MTTTYGTRAGIESIVSPAALLAYIDDDQNGVESASEAAHVTNAIERAAVTINMAVSRQYDLADVTANTWLVWANNAMAAEMLATRRGNPAPQSLMDAVKEIEELLNEIRWGRASLPEQVPSYDFGPAVTNFHPELGRRDMPVRVSRDESTGAAPVDGIKRYYADESGVY